MFSCLKQYLTRSLRSLVRYCFCHSNIKSISLRNRLISYIYYFPYFTLTYVRLRVFHILWWTPCFPYDSVFSIFFSDVRLRVFHNLLWTPCFPYDSVFSIFFSDVRLRVFHMTPCFPYFYDVRLRDSDSGTPTPGLRLRNSDSVFSI